MLGRDQDQDPLDISRILIADAARKAAMYADMVERLVEERDDDRAHAMFGAVLTQVASLKTAFTSLAAGRTARPAADARKHLPDAKEAS